MGYANPLTLDSVIRRPASDVVTQYGLHICYIYDSFDLFYFKNSCVCDSQLIDLEVSDLVTIIEINDDADKIDINNIDVDKILTSDDIDDKNDVDKIFTFDDINDEPHNGKPIIIIEISPKENYLITYSKEDRSIAGWNVEDMDKVQLKFDQTVKINEDKGIRSSCVSDDKKLAYISNDYKCTITEAFFSEQSSEQTDDEQTKFVLRILNGRVWKSKFMSKTNKNSDELSKENNKIIECDDVDKHLNVHSFNLYMDAVPTLFQKAITNDLHRVQKSTVSTENLIKWDMNINHIEINLAVFKKHNTEWNLVISRRIDNHHYKYKYSAITKINYELVI
ncbi:hypothetical protein GLOIN_2v1729118 [Rhizophagus irregularis DAOM 181602=DAOM 197198]|nr:hypothetical protein GLOIN_2v1729118 [Rhizophagus irregularis DAOM 181602=DAOM 197198]